MTTTLTSRGRALLRLASFASILILAFALFGAKAQGATTEAGRSVSGNYQQITILPGETLWQIAELVGTQTDFRGDLRDLVDEIISLNGLSSPAISAGSHLLIPLAK